MAIHLDLEAELPADLLTVDALALDLDGTLARNDKHVSDATIAALARLHATGVAIIVATGRVYPATVGIYERANIDGPLIAASGAMAVASVRDYAHGVAGAASYEPMDDALYARILDFCRKHNLQLVIFGRDHLFAKEDGEAVRVLAERNEGEQPIVADLEELPREDRLKAALFASDAEYERIRADLAAEFPNF
ncbi:HAD hydrolase family protein, partial [Actinotignum schaalii]